MTPRSFAVVAAVLLSAGCASTATAPPAPAASAATKPEASQAAGVTCVREPDAPIAIPWEDAVVMIENARVRAIYQSHCLDVRLDTLDGESYTTIEPALDEVFRIADGAPNGDQIIRATD
jgi:hypothetical protein